VKYLLQQRKSDITVILTGLPGGGGVSRRRLTLVKYFNSKGLKVDVLSFMPKSKSTLHKEFEKVARVITLDNILTRYSNRNIYAIIDFPKLLKYLKYVQPKSILSAMEYPNFYSIMAKRIINYKGRVVISEHGHMASINKSRSFIHKMITNQIWASYKHADAIVAVSSGIKQELIEKGCHPDKVHVIYNPVIDDNLFTQANEFPNHKWFVNKDIKVVLSVGRLVKEKDYPSLLRAFAIVRKECNANLLILGEGTERGKLQTLINELSISGFVDMPGFVRNPYCYMRHSDVFVLSSITEGMVGVLIEAMALGTPVISTDCPTSPREILKDGKYGDLVPVGDYEVLAERIIEYLTNPKQDTQETQKWVIERFSVQQAAEEYLKLLF